MMRQPGALLVSGLLIKDMILYPGRVFRQERSYDSAKGAMILFLAGLLITFLKSLSVAKKGVTPTFFGGSVLNSLFLWLNNPQVRWVVVYCAYFLFIFLIILLCKLLIGRIDARLLVLSLISVSAIGVMLQVFFYTLKFILPQNVVVIFGYVAYLWVAFVSLKAVAESQKMSFIRAAVCFGLPAIVTIILAGLPAISPYLAWLAQE
jgi:hypothetical protein